MAVVKISKKEKLDELVAKLTLRLGKRPTQQQVLDLCVELGIEHFELLLAKMTTLPILNDEKIKKIKNISSELADVPWIIPTKDDFAGKNDSDVYST
ncbi:MAG: hypothetical protein ACTSRG_18960 [Candidatus Helarchaeota archaeon]